MRLVAEVRNGNFPEGYVIQRAFRVALHNPFPVSATVTYWNRDVNQRVLLDAEKTEESRE